MDKSCEEELPFIPKYAYRTPRGERNFLRFNPFRNKTEEITDCYQLSSIKYHDNHAQKCSYAYSTPTIVITQDDTSYRTIRDPRKHWSEKLIDPRTNKDIIYDGSTQTQEFIMNSIFKDRPLFIDEEDGRLREEIPCPLAGYPKGNARGSCLALFPAKENCERKTRRFNRFTGRVKVPFDIENQCKEQASPKPIPPADAPAKPLLPLTDRASDWDKAMGEKIKNATSAEELANFTKEIMDKWDDIRPENKQILLQNIIRHNKTSKDTLKGIAASLGERWLKVVTETPAGAVDFSDWWKLDDDSRILNDILLELSASNHADLAVYSQAFHAFGHYWKCASDEELHCGSYAETGSNKDNIVDPKVTYQGYYFQIFPQANFSQIMQQMHALVSRLDLNKNAGDIFEAIRNSPFYGESEN